MDIKVLTASPPGSLTPASTRHFVEMRLTAQPLIYRLFMEMNSPHTPFHADHQGGGAIGQGRYVRAWRHVWGLADAVGATTRAGGNVIFVYCPQAYSSGDPNQWQTTYPGDDVVDIFGLDLYRDTFADGADNPAKAEGSTHTPAPTTNRS